MADQALEVKVPGKLFIAGEYAILEKDQHAVVIAVDRYMYGIIQPSDINQLSLPQLGYEQVYWEESGGDIVFSVPSEKLTFIKESIILVNQLLKESQIQQRAFSLKVTSQLDDGKGKKYGLGSSAAITVTVIISLLHFYNMRPEMMTIYKLAAIAHYRAQGNGSCADIAASTYGGWLQYSMFRPEWLRNEIKQGTKLVELLNLDWPGLHIQSLTPPADLNLAVGWTKNAASTAPMVKSIQSLKDKNDAVFSQFLNKSKQAVSNLVDSFIQKDCNQAIVCLAENREALHALSELATVEIETPELKTLIEIANKYGSGKSSGAGGGDCGIAFVKNRENVDQLKQEWKNKEIFPLEINVSIIGATVKEKSY